jgi:hypothetical protein
MASPFTVKKKVKVTETITKIKTKTIDMIDWSKVPNGTYMTAKIEGKLCKGAIYKEGTNMWFCQNSKDGDGAPYNLGFKYSWIFRQTPDGTHSSGVTDIKFPPKPARVNIEPLPAIIKVGTYNAVVGKNSITVGCQTITRAQVKAVWDAMNKIK